MSLLFTVSGPSGVGKTTLCKRLPLEIPQVRLSISCTTRAPRPHEKDGKDYYFLSPEEFTEGLKQNRFLEWTQVHESYYGTDARLLRKALDSKTSIILNIDSVGAKKIKELFGSQAISIFIEPPSLDVLKERLIIRGTEATDEVQRRLQHGILELQEADWFDYRILNEEFSTAYQNIKQLLLNLLQKSA